MLLGGTDYAIVRGMNNTFSGPTGACAPLSPADNGDFGVGVMGVRGHRDPVKGMIQGKIRFADVIDGASNTIMVAEDAGRQQVWANGQMVMPNAPGQVGWTLNAAWADYNNYIRVRGFSANGLVQDGGCCVINCNNVNQIYAFHSGGTNTLRADASVHFMAAAISPATLAALVSRAGNEPIKDEDQ
jgi:hypothetical protein